MHAGMNKQCTQQQMNKGTHACLSQCSPPTPAYRKNTVLRQSMASNCKTMVRGYLVISLKVCSGDWAPADCSIL